MKPQPTKLTVRFHDDFDRFVAMNVHGGSAPVQYRIVTIELTAEQQAALAPRKIGTARGIAYYESWEVLALEKEEET